MKYDDFGRPIYETAEEYNRAHREQKATHSYTNTDGDVYQSSTASQRHTMRAKSKQVKPIVVGLIVFTIAINLGIIATLFNITGSFSSGVFEEGFEEMIPITPDEEGEYLGDTTTPLPEGFDTVIYKGQVITLPTTYEEISKLNFDIDTEYSRNEEVPWGYSELADLVDADGNVFGYVSVDNYTEEELPLRKCTVDYISIQNPAAYDDTEDVPEFEFGNGLTFESSYEEIEAYFGIPYYHYEDDSDVGCIYDSYEWQYYGDEETHYVNISFWNGVISDISIQRNIIVNEEIY